MNIFQQFLEFMNGQNTKGQNGQEFGNGTDNTSAEEKIEKHEDMEAEFAKELSALLKKYGVELEDDEYESESDENKEDDEKEDDKKGNDKKEDKKEDKEDDEKEFSNSSDFAYFKQQHNKTVKAAPAVDYQSIDDQRKLGKEIW